MATIQLKKAGEISKGIILGFETDFVEDPDNGEPSLWIFGYGSLLWNVGFKYAESVKAKLTGYSRRFFHANMNFRGTPELVRFILRINGIARIQCSIWGMMCRPFLHVFALV